MKRIVLIGLVLMILTAGMIRGEERFNLRLSGCVKFVNNDIYKQVYGDTVFYPELRMSVRLFAGFHIWFGFGYVNVNGETSETKAKTTLNENQYMAGLGYVIKAGEKLRVFLEGGYLRVRDTEKALGETENGSASGFTGNVGVIYKFSKFIGLVLGGGYMQAKDKIEGETIDFGGTTGSLGLQFSF